MPSSTKTAVAAALAWSRLDAFLGRKPRSVPLILGYHRVVESFAAVREPALPAMVVSQRTLRLQLEWVARRFRVVSLDELGTWLELGMPCGKLAAITFDDGYRDVHDYALPLLDAMGLPSAVFVVTGAIASAGPLLHDQLYRIAADALSAGRALPAPLALALGRRPEPRRGEDRVLATVRALLASRPSAELRRIVDELNAQAGAEPAPKDPATVDWQALRAMHRAGTIIGSHTHSHALLNRESDPALAEELTRSRDTIAAALGAPVHHFAYPDGRFDPRVVRAVAAAGYRFAYTICDHRDRSHPLLTLPRVMLWEGSCTRPSGGFSPSLMRCHASSVLPLFSRCHDAHGGRSRWPTC